MIADLSGVERVATMTRHDFENRAVRDEEIIEAAIALNAVFNIAQRFIDREGAPALVEAGKLIKIDHLFVEVPIIHDGNNEFPLGFCNITTPVLAQRLQESGVLGENTVKIVEGGCGEDKDAFDPVGFYFNYHAFLGIGKTSRGDDTIVDITADQFTGYRLPPVYVGPCKFPWRRDARIEQHEW